MNRIDLQFRSQVWRGIPWEHTLHLFLPDAPVHSDVALLYITGDGANEADAYIGTAAAQHLQAPVAVLYNVPNQPLFGELIEDELIAYTFDQYLESGDDSWPLLFPMVRSAQAAMDQVQKAARKHGFPVERFVVTGASKRGWTTWLTATKDPRVCAIAPIVFDNLNFPAQMLRQRELWGGFSEQIHDYTERDLQAKMESELGKRLVGMIDPYFSRDRLTIPKLLINGANDRYWATDATRIYWHDLVGEKYLLTVPNEGHSLLHAPRVLHTLTAFFHAAATGRPLPRLEARHTVEDGCIRLTATSSEEPERVRLWAARSSNFDFRTEPWSSLPMSVDGDEYLAEVPLPGPRSGGLALFVEAGYHHEGDRFTLSAPTAVFGEH